MAQGTGNPFVVRPGGDLSRGLYGLAGQVDKMVDRKREDTAVAKEEQKQLDAQQRSQSIKQEFATALQSNDPQEILRAYGKYPVMAKEYQLMERQGFQDASTLNNARETGYRVLASGNAEDAKSFLEARIPYLQSQGVPIEKQKDTQELIDLFGTDPDAAMEQVKGFVARIDPDGYEKYLDFKGEGGGEAKPAEQVAFEALIEEFSPEDQVKARRVKARIDPGAVGSSMQTITQLGLAKLIADSEATIAERKKFAEMQGSQRSQYIDKGYEKVVKLDKYILNLDKALEAAIGGANSGTIERKFPSFKESSILLDQLQGELGLDVIGGVTLGAINEKELDLALQVGLPTGLQGDALIKWITEKKEAQNKLRAYFKDQIEFLDQGGSIAGFVRKKTREQKASAQPDLAASAQAEMLRRQQAGGGQ